MSVSLECGDLSPLWSRAEREAVVCALRAPNKAATSRRTPGRRPNISFLCTKVAISVARIRELKNFLAS